MRGIAIVALLSFVGMGQQTKPAIPFPDGTALYRTCPLSCNAGQCVNDLRECDEYKVSIHHHEHLPPAKPRKTKRLGHHAARSERNSSNSSSSQNQPSKDPWNISDFNDTAPHHSHFAVNESFDGNSQK
jgi:hypothetical protein